jgi:hypothetical protein
MWNIFLVWGVFEWRRGRADSVRLGAVRLTFTLIMNICFFFWEGNDFRIRFGSSEFVMFKEQPVNLLHQRIRRSIFVEPMTYLEMI